METRVHAAPTDYVWFAIGAAGVPAGWGTEQIDRIPTALNDAAVRDPTHDPGPAVAVVVRHQADVFGDSARLAFGDGITGRSPPARSA